VKETVQPDDSVWFWMKFWRK